MFPFNFDYENNLFRKWKYFVSKTETKCFEVRNTYETKSSFPRR